MLVRFDSKVGMIQMFGDVAKRLLRMMGQSGDVPGAILGADVPAAVERLKTAVGAETPPQPEAGATRSENDKERDPADLPVGLAQRAFPLIELLERAAKAGEDVIWRPEGQVADDLVKVRGSRAP